MTLSGVLRDLFHFIINSKNYEEAAGPKALRLANSISRSTSVANANNVKLHLACPAFSISQVAKSYPRISVFAQHLDLAEPGSSTGFLSPQIAKLSGAEGSLVNHSEHRLSLDKIEALVKTLKSLGLESVVCARDPREVKKVARYEPNYVAIEPPELIGSGTAVSRARPTVITESRKALESTLGKTRSTILLCGAGIVDAIDVTRAKELGAEGILVASGVIKAKNWSAKIQSLTRGFGT